ncbi:MAG: LacI family transcriptional regulator [Chloroflexi bacterium]|nr:MAG: LacI family transcriptional regulator [Chloroflexota bacterium]HDN79251.1 LacI family transcriptional regulator [Chloroflexota bacterium]
MPVTLKDIARRLNISVTTVSRALHGYEDVAEETRQKVLALAEELGYRPHILAQRLQKGRTDTIGFIIPTFGPRFSDPFFSELLAGIGNEAARHDYDLLVSTCPPDTVEEVNAYEQFVMGRRVDGLLITRTRVYDQRIAYLLEKEFPFVAFGRSKVEGDFCYVDVDSEEGIRLVTRHLIEMGHRRIAMILPPSELMFSVYRRIGFQKALEKNGLEFDEELVEEGDLTERGGYEAALRLLDKPHPPTAIVACNDLMAVGAIGAAQEHRLKVGRDIAITGFDDVPLAEHTVPPLTTVRQPVYEIGRRICQMLIYILEGKPLPQRQVILKPKLVIRESSNFHL